LFCALFKWRSDEFAGWKPYANDLYQLKYPSEWTTKKGTQSKNDVIASNGSQSLSILVNLKGAGGECSKPAGNENLTVTNKSVSAQVLNGITDENCDSKDKKQMWFSVENSSNTYTFVFEYKLADEVQSKEMLNKILSTFKFTDQQTSQRNTYKSDLCGFSLSYPVNWKVKNTECVDLLAPDYEVNGEAYAGFAVNIGRVKLGTPSESGKVYNSLNDYINDYKSLFSDITPNKIYGNLTGTQAKEVAMLPLQKFMFVRDGYIYIVSWKDGSGYDGQYSSEVNDIISSIEF
jgi:hypothetical protein